jgi:hypothetical protein
MKRAAPGTLSAHFEYVEASKKYRCRTCHGFVSYASGFTRHRESRRCFDAQLLEFFPQAEAARPHAAGQQVCRPPLCSLYCLSTVHWLLINATICLPQTQAPVDVRPAFGDDGPALYGPLAASQAQLAGEGGGPSLGHAAAPGSASDTVHEGLASSAALPGSAPRDHFDSQHAAVDPCVSPQPVDFAMLPSGADVDDACTEDPGGGGSWGVGRLRRNRTPWQWVFCGSTTRVSDAQSAAT